MINHGGAGRALGRENGFFAALLTRGPFVAHGGRHERPPRHLRHLPRDYELAIRWLEPSYLKNIESTGRPAGSLPALAFACSCGALGCECESRYTGKGLTFGATCDLKFVAEPAASGISNRTRHLDGFPWNCVFTIR